MIKAALEKDEGGFRLDISGHADFAPKGEDLLCAAVSALVWGLAGYVRRLEKEGMALSATGVELEPGRAVIQLCPEPQARGRAAGAFGLAAEILALLGKNYPENIQFTVKRRNK